MNTSAPLSPSTTPFISFVVAVGIMLQAFGAVYKPEFLGFLAASPGVLSLLLAAVLSFRYALASWVAGSAWLLLAWGLVTCSISMAYFGWHELYAEKMFNLMILSMVWIAPLLCIHALSINTLKWGLGIGLVICFLGYLLSDLFPGALPAFVREWAFGGGYDIYYDARPRAFMTEPSHFGTILGRYGILLYLIFEIGRPLDRVRLLIALVILAALLLLSGSKGAAVAMALSLVMLVTNRRAFGLAVVLIPAAWWLLSLQFDAFATDLERFTSTGTRVGLWLAGLGAILSNPLGWGYYGFYGTASLFGHWAMDLLYGYQLRLSELEMIVGELTSVSYKSTLLDFTVVFGWPFLFFLYRIMREIDFSDLRVRCSATFLIILGLSTSGHESISFFIGLAFLLRFYPRVKTNTEAGVFPIQTQTGQHREVVSIST